MVSRTKITTSVKSLFIVLTSLSLSSSVRNYVLPSWLRPSIWCKSGWGLRWPLVRRPLVEVGLIQSRFPAMRVRPCLRSACNGAGALEQPLVILLGRSIWLGSYATLAEAAAANTQNGRRGARLVTAAFAIKLIPFFYALYDALW
jgi:hypothetical protein